MKKLVFLLTFLVISDSYAQSSGPYSIRCSMEFESMKGHRDMFPVAYGEEGIIQVNMRGMKSFAFQQFSNALKMEKTNIAEVESKFNDGVNYEGFIKLKNKTYLFAREVFKETKTEGITALEFLPKSLDFGPDSKNLFKSSDKVIGGYYGFDVSDDRTKFVFIYTLVRKDRRDKLNKDDIGLQVFDENLNKVWGEEIEMPYTEAKMDNLGYTLADDGKVYLLAKVFDGDDRKEVKEGKPNFHYEVIAYQAGSKKPNIIEIKLDNNYPTEAYIYEDIDHNIVVAGFYSKAVNKPIEGAYMVKLDVDKSVAVRLNGGYYEIPSDVIKAFTSERELRKMEKKEEKDADKDIGIANLEIRDIYSMKDGSTKIISEQYKLVVTTHYNGKTTTTTYRSYYDDIFVMSISKAGVLEWVKKIPKAQRSGDAMGAGLSINSYAIENDVHIFFIDHIENFDLPIHMAPKVHQNNRGGFLTGVNISQTGEIKKYNLGEIKVFDTNFFIRYFKDGKRNNLISTERKKKKNLLFSLDIRQKS